MIKAWLFDLDDTLYDYKKLNPLAIKALEAYTCEELKVTPKAFQEAFLFAREETKRLLPNVAAGHNRMIYCQKILEYFNLNPISVALEMYETYWSYMLNNMKLNTEVLELFEYCKEKKIKIGIGTDLTANIQHRKLRALKISQYIDAIVTSEEAGKEKPDKNLFCLLLEKLDVKANEAIYVGDSLEKDVEGAEAVGIKAFLYTNRNDEQVDCINDLRKLISYYDKN